MESNKRKSEETFKKPKNKIYITVKKLKINPLELLSMKNYKPGKNKKYKKINPCTKDM